jgi:hypothetical protein
MSRPKYTDETILSIAKTTSANARKRLDSFVEFGITEVALNEFDQKIIVAEKTPSHLALRIEQKELTSTKNNVLAECVEWINKLKTRMEFAFRKNSPELAAFPLKELKKAVNSEDQMMRMMEICLNIGDKHKSVLVVHGQTPEVLNRGRQLHTELSQADRVQEIQKSNKRSVTQERNELFQELYDTVNKINKAGQIIFKNDPVNRVLFDSKWPKPTKVKEEPEAPGTEEKAE